MQAVTRGMGNRPWTDAPSPQPTRRIGCITRCIPTPCLGLPIYSPTFLALPWCGNAYSNTKTSTARNQQHSRMYVAVKRG